MIKLYDTKQRKKVNFKPREQGKVAMYVCGPTVYNRIHIGNARTFISFDMIRRYLEWRGYEVTFVQNVTDVDDKIITKANQEGRTAAEVAQEYTQAFIDDMHKAGVKDPTIRPKATEEIDTMIALVERLIEKGHAYAVEGDVYFSVRSDKNYGSLSGRNIDEMEGGHRELRADGAGLEDRKQDPLDFALWKAAKPGEPSWPSPWGQGRPGWHIECSAMSAKYLGLPFDIHGGGADLVFPHHENEQAQSECAYDCEFANYWMHSGMLQINSEKMSKSLGNFLLLNEVLKDVRPEVLRMLTLQTHYRSPLDFSQDRLRETEAALSRIENALENIDWSCKNVVEGVTCIDAPEVESAISKAKEQFIEAMDDDFNAPAALGAIFTLVNETNTMLAGKTLSPADVELAKNLQNTITELLDVLGIDLTQNAQNAQEYPQELVELAKQVADVSASSAKDALDAIIEARAGARASKNWALADQIRDGLAALGITVKDTPQGAQITFEK